MNELHKFQRRLIRSVQRLRLKENKTREEVFETLRKETGRDCELIWERMRALTLKKLSRLLAVDDDVSRVGAVARMSSTDWLMFDLVLAHEEDINVVHTDSNNTSLQVKDCKALRDLFQLVQEEGIMFFRGDKLAEAWISLTRQYNKKGRCCSPMLLQKRWYRMCESTRYLLYEFWHKWRGSERNLPTAMIKAPPKLQREIALRYPNIILEPFKTWEELLQEKEVIRYEELVELMKAKNERSKPSENEPDLIILEPRVETIDLAASSDDGETKDYDDVPTNEQVLPTAVKIKEEPIYPPEDATPIRENLSDDAIIATIKADTIAAQEAEDTDVPENVNDGLSNVQIIDTTHVATICLDNTDGCANDEVATNDVHNELDNTNRERDNVIVKAENVEILENDDHNAVQVLDEEMAKHDINTDTVAEPMTACSLDDRPMETPQTNTEQFIEDDEDEGEYLNLDDSYSLNEEQTVHHEVKSEDEEVHCRKIDLKLMMEPTVSTVKLDDMNILKDIDFDHIECEDILNKIAILSKPLGDRNISQTHAEVSAVVQPCSPIIIPVTDTEQSCLSEDNLSESQGDLSQNCKEIKLSAEEKDTKIIETKSDIDDATNHEVDSSSEEDEVPNEARAKITNKIFSKPQNRSYNSIQLCKNPDFNTRLRRLPVSFFVDPRNCRLLNMCQPLTVDLCRSFESKLRGNTIYLKRDDSFLKKTKKVETKESNELNIELNHNVSSESIEDDTNTLIAQREKNRVIHLPNREQVRRVNQHLLTAEVPPIQVHNQTTIPIDNISPDEVKKTESPNTQPIVSCQTKLPEKEVVVEDMTLNGSKTSKSFNNAVNERNKAQTQCNVERSKPKPSLWRVKPSWYRREEKKPEPIKTDITSLRKMYEISLLAPSTLTKILLLFDKDLNETSILKNRIRKQDNKPATQNNGNSETSNVDVEMELGKPTPENKQNKINPHNATDTQDKAITNSDPVKKPNRRRTRTKKNTAVRPKPIPKPKTKVINFPRSTSTTRCCDTNAEVHTVSIEYNVAETPQEITPFISLYPLRKSDEEPVIVLSDDEKEHGNERDKFIIRPSITPASTRTPPVVTKSNCNKFTPSEYYKLFEYTLDGIVERSVNFRVLQSFIKNDPDCIHTLKARMDKYRNPVRLSETTIILAAIRVPEELYKIDLIEPPVVEQPVIMINGANIVMLPNGEVSCVLDQNFNNEDFPKLSQVCETVQKELKLPDPITITTMVAVDPGLVTNTNNTTDTLLNDNEINYISNVETDSTVTKDETHKMEVSNTPLSVLGQEITSVEDVVNTHTVTPQDADNSDNQTSETLNSNQENVNDTRSNTVAVASEAEDEHDDCKTKETGNTSLEDTNQVSKSTCADILESKEQNEVNAVENESIKTNTESATEDVNHATESGNKASILSDLMAMSGISSDDFHTEEEAAVVPAPQPPLVLHQEPVASSPPPLCAIPRTETSFDRHLSPVTSVEVLKYASERNAKFFKLDMINGNLAPVNVTFQNCKKTPSSETEIKNKPTPNSRSLLKVNRLAQEAMSLKVKNKDGRPSHFIINANEKPDRKTIILRKGMIENTNSTKGTPLLTDLGPKVKARRKQIIEPKAVEVDEISLSSTEEASMNSPSPLSSDDEPLAKKARKTYPRVGIFEDPFDDDEIYTMKSVLDTLSSEGEDAMDGVHEEGESDDSEDGDYILGA